jgi:hypothetical protein
VTMVAVWLRIPDVRVRFAAGALVGC